MNRRQTIPVRVGHLVMGGNHPIVIQSMTTTTPEDLPGTLAQIEALHGAGCPLVRLAIPSVRAAAALRPLRKAMTERELHTPLVADVHFNPRVALDAARHVEKVRINPGNFASSAQEARRHMRPLLDLLKARGVALRIGVNHGSLSPYIVDAYGHGPKGMVASAMEYLRICRDAGFNQVVVALKASNPSVMVEANRSLASDMREEGMEHPIHLGVTEAGEGLEGALRSAVGIGTLLLEGIGDTIRVSLTGDPVREIAICGRILLALEDGAAQSWTGPPGAWRDQAQAGRPQAVASDWGGLAVGGSQPPRVELAVNVDRRLLDPSSAEREKFIDRVLASTQSQEGRAESLLLRWMEPLAESTSTGLQILLRELRARLADLEDPPPIWLELPMTLIEAQPRIGSRPSIDPQPGIGPPPLSKPPIAHKTLTPRELLFPLLASVEGLCLHIHGGGDGPSDAEAAWLAQIARHRPGLLLRWHLDLDGESAPPVRELLAASRRAAFPVPCFSFHSRSLAQTGHMLAFLLAEASDGDPRPILIPCLPRDLWEAAVHVGSLLLDGLADVLLVGDPPVAAAGETLPLDVAYALLQASRRRLTRAEFISCPGCGRLNYDLEGTVQRVKARFGHLRGLKIAVMGCAVNGPGEMADADFGYVGSASGELDLYAGRQRIHRALTPEVADELLVALLQERGLWTDPPGDGASPGIVDACP